MHLYDLKTNTSDAVFNTKYFIFELRSWLKLCIFSSFMDFKICLSLFFFPIDHKEMGISVTERNSTISA